MTTIKTIQSCVLNVIRSVNIFEKYYLHIAGKSNGLLVIFFAAVCSNFLRCSLQQFSSQVKRKKQKGSGWDFFLREVSSKSRKSKSRIKPLNSRIRTTTKMSFPSREDEPYYYYSQHMSRNTNQRPRWKFPNLAENWGVVYILHSLHRFAASAAGKLFP